MNLEKSELFKIYNLLAIIFIKGVYKLNHMCYNIKVGRGITMTHIHKKMLDEMIETVKSLIADLV